MTYMTQSAAVADQMDVYGMLYTSAGTTSKTFTSGIPQDVEFDSSGPERKTVLGVDNIKIQVPGVYLVFFQISHKWSINDFLMTVKLTNNGSDTGCGFTRFITNTFAVNIEDSCSFCWLGEFSEDDVLKVNITTNKTGDLVVVNSQFVVRRIF